MATVWLVSVSERYDCAYEHRAFSSAERAEAWIARQPKESVIPGDERFPEMRTEIIYTLDAVEVDAE
jgi:hypothetical protein